jgi:hypothetical protein
MQKHLAEVDGLVDMLPSEYPGHDLETSDEEVDIARIAYEVSRAFI